MDQIFFKDWTVPHLGREKYFLNAEDLENCVTERILRNTFHDPLISSDDEEPEDIDWNEVFKNKKNNEKNHRLFIPGCRGVPKYPKLSSLSPVQHTQLLKVICANNPHILPQKNFPRPSRIDVKMFESLKSQYEEEKRDFIDWAKTLWASEHCIRALRPKPPVELAYEAQFKLRATELQSYPKTFSLAAQIPLQGNGDFEMTFCEELIRINEKDLPEIKQEMIEEKLSIIKPGAVPEPCIKHPCKFILPMEKSVSILPLTEIERELAQYALEQGAQYIASESALQCLLSFGRAWNITVNICEVIDSNGDKTNVTVLGSEFAIKKENVLQRTYKAFKHLLEDALIPLSERANLLSKLANRDDEDDLNITSMDIPEPVLEPSSDDEETNLCIDICDDIQKNCEKENSQKKEDDVTQETPLPNNNTLHKFGYYDCSCKDTMFEMPPPRSYKRWRLRNVASGDRQDIIVHCAHEVRSKTEEVVLEPIPEYQIECGAVSLSQDKIAALALSLILKQRASLLKVRVEGSSGEIVTMEKMSLANFKDKYGDMQPRIANVLYSTLDQLEGLLPGKYVLHHDPSHGENAMLYSQKVSSGPTLQLDIDLNASPPSDESTSLKTAPTLCDDLLPVHKFRRTLPCAFTPYKDQLPKHVPKTPARSKTPPQAIKSAAGRGRKPRTRGGRSRNKQ